MNKTPHRWFALLETAHHPYDQFAANALRDIVGSAELAHQAGTRFVLEAVRECGGPALVPDPAKPAAQNLRRGILAGQEGGMLAWRPIEAIAASGGQAILLADSEARARKIIQLATLKALRNAPGLEFRGAFVPVSLDAWNPPGVAEALGQAKIRLDEARARIPGPDSRFPRLPLVEPCAFSDQPASTLRSFVAGQPAVPVALTTLRRREAAEAGWRRLTTFAAGRMAESLSQAVGIFEQAPRIAVVRLVVQGRDQAERALSDAQRFTTAEHALQERRRFAMTLDECAELAVADAASIVEIGPEVVFAPLAIQGGEATVLCDSARAGAFARECEAAWRKRSESLDGSEPRIATLAPCVGVAIADPNQRLDDALRLAEKSLSGANQS